MNIEYIHNRITDQVALVFVNKGAILFPSREDFRNFALESLDYANEISTQIPDTFTRAFDKED